MKVYSPDVLIVGAGPAGCTAASLLHRQGFSPLVIEKEKFPRFVIGESLLPQCMDLLEEADLLSAAEAQHFQNKNGAIFLHGQNIETFEFGEQFTQGWKRTYQVPRAQFDQMLADCISAKGIPVWYQSSLKNMECRDSGPEVRVVKQAGEEVTLKPRFVLDASGYGRVLPRLLNLEIPSAFPPRAALFAHLEEDKNNPAIDYEKIWVCIQEVNPEIWFWVIPFSNGSTSVGIVGPGNFLQDQATDLKERFLSVLQADPRLKQRFKNPVFTMEPREINGYAAAVKNLYGPGYALLGNAAEFLDPVFSSGVTIAMKSAQLAAHVLIRQLRGEKVDWQEEYAQVLMRGIDTFRAFVAGWYDGTLQKIIFFPRKKLGIKKMVCSVLAGYAWDMENPYVNRPRESLKHLSDLCNSLS